MGGFMNNKKTSTATESLDPQMLADLDMFLDYDVVAEEEDSLEILDELNELEHEDSATTDKQEDL